MSVSQTLNELKHAGTASALYLGGLYPRRSVDTVQGARGRVVLTHGIGHNRSWAYSMSRALAAAGYTCSASNYPSLTQSFQYCADVLAEHLLTQMHLGPVDVVAHSFGGLVLRQALKDSRLHGGIRTVVTLASPHRGTPSASAKLGWVPVLGRSISALAPGSAFLEELSEGSHSAGASWWSVGSVHDLVVPGPYAVLDIPVYDARNVTLSGVGHMGMMHDAEVIDVVVSALREQ